VATSHSRTRLAAKLVGSRHRAATFVLQVSNLCTEKKKTLFCILIWRTIGKFVWKHKELALGFCFPQACSSAGRMFATSRSHLDYYRPIGSIPHCSENEFEEMCCKLKSTENLGSSEKYPTLPQNDQNESDALTCVWRGSFVCMTWPIWLCDMMCKLTRSRVWVMRDMTYFCVWRVGAMRLLPDPCDITHS